MSTMVCINNRKIVRKEYKGQPVITFKEIDKVHNRPEGTAGRNFRQNREHFIEGVDFFEIQSDEIRRFGILSPKGGYLVTESGYLMLAKSFTDDLAWSVQRQLVNTYFRAKEEPPKKEYTYLPKTYKGQPVITLRDLEYFTGYSPKASAVQLHNKRYKWGVDCWLLEGDILKEFKRENPKFDAAGSSFIVLSKSGFIKLAKAAKSVPNKLIEPFQAKALPAPTIPIIEEDKIDITQHPDYAGFWNRIKELEKVLPVVLNNLGRRHHKSDVISYSRVVLDLSAQWYYNVSQLTFLVNKM